MVADLLGKQRGDANVAGYLGMLVGSYSLVEVAVAWGWGRLSDLLGRRRVLLLGLSGSAVPPLIMGFASSYPVAIAARMADGFFCGNLGVSRTLLGELVDPSNETWAYGWFTSFNILGTLVGTALGGILANPAENFPGVFSNTIFDTWPYLLPNLILASLTVGSFFFAFCVLPDTSHSPRREASSSFLDATEAARSCLSIEGSVIISPNDVAIPSWRVRDNPILVRFLVGMFLTWSYWAVRFQGFVAIVSLGRDINGFALNSASIGGMQMVVSCVTFMYQSLLFQRVVRKFGHVRCMQVAIASTILWTLPFPAYGLLADADRFGFWRIAVLIGHNVLVEVSFNNVFPCMWILLNRHCTNENRGAVNGLTQCIAAFSNGAFSMIGDFLVAVGCNIETDFDVWGGRYLVFYLNMILGFLGVYFITQVPGLPQTDPRETCFTDSLCES
eukprot:TRINITY_DN12_c0_g1_i1.p1 TRINITY_DN12_c0_g1~~TRINITY_DN12_c0_g1_i1.p1  ORF type:complete len:506 (+),score=36.30 TRINITY_DN12_c0_g1_i1:184-1518(+)